MNFDETGKKTGENHITLRYALVGNVADACLGRTWGQIQEQIADQAWYEIAVYIHRQICKEIK